MFLLILSSDYKCTGWGQETTPGAVSTEGSKSGSVLFLLRQILGWNKQLLSIHHDEMSLNVFSLHDHMDLLKKKDKQIKRRLETNFLELIYNFH